MIASIRIETLKNGEPRIIHDRECDECGGTGQSSIGGCKYGTCSRRCVSPCGEDEKCSASGCVEGRVQDDDCHCVECQAAYDAWLKTHQPQEVHAC